MGCDIHAYVEVRKNGRWEYLGIEERNRTGEIYEDGYFDFDDQDEAIRFDRDYWLFAILAGVRDYWDVKPISEPKDMPADATAEVLKKFEDDCGHNVSWLSVAELLAWDRNAVAKAFEAECPKRPVTYYDFCPWFWDRVVPAMRELGDPDDVRLVFWFDN